MSEREAQRSVLGNEFVQFLGGVINNMTSPGGPFEGRPQAAAHETIAVVAEELLKLTKDKDGDVDFFRAKPLIRAAIFLVQQYLKDIETSDEVDDNLKASIRHSCTYAIDTLNIITVIEEDGQGD